MTPKRNMRRWRRARRPHRGHEILAAALADAKDEKIPTNDALARKFLNLDSEIERGRAEVRRLEMALSSAIDALEASQVAIGASVRAYRAHRETTSDAVAF